jgi:MFS transporter, DHA1 family, tetracycline resistance protein
MRFLPLLLTVFLDSLGFGLVFPIFSPLIMNQSEGWLGPETSLAARGVIFSVMVCSFCLGQFFGGPLLGGLSDRQGRKKILLMSIWLHFFSYLLTAGCLAAQSVAGLFISRLLSGIAAGNYAVVQSIVADKSTPENKSNNFALIGMAWGTGFIIGPFIGGKLSDPHFAPFCGWETPFLFAACLALLNIVLLALRLKETFPLSQSTKINFLKGITDIKVAFQHPQLRYLFLVMFIFSFGWGFFTEFSGVFLIRRFGFDQGGIGNFYAWVGVWIAICQGILIRPLLKRFTSHRLLLGALLSIGIIMPLMLMFDHPNSVFWILPLVAFPEALIYPTSSTIVSNLTPKESQGEMLGIHNSVQWAAIGIAPLFSGAFVALYPHLPITVSSFCMFTGFSVFAWVLRKKKIPV